MPEKRWLKPKEAAEILGLHVQTIYAKTLIGIIPSVKVGGALRIDGKKLNEALEAQIKKRIKGAEVAAAGRGGSSR